MQRAGRLVPLASGFPQDQDALQIDTDARILGATIETGQRITYPLLSTRYGYLVPTRGRIVVNDQQVGEGDGIAIADETRIAITAIQTAEFILVDAA
jgi:redox-sensitive bicupin YhaK (pirin superfamily)